HCKTNKTAKPPATKATTRANASAIMPALMARSRPATTGATPEAWPDFIPYMPAATVVNSTIQKRCPTQPKSQSKNPNMNPAGAATVDRPRICWSKSGATNCMAGSSLTRVWPTTANWRTQENTETGKGCQGKERKPLTYLG